MVTTQLMQGDCLELMKAIPDASVDMVLCDLPYGTTSNKWDVCIPFPPLWEQWHRVSKPATPVLLFGQMPFTADVVNSNRKEFRYEWVWQKANGTGFLNAKKAPLKAHETIQVFYNTLPVYHPQKTSGKPYTRAKTSKGSTNYREMDPWTTVSEDGLRYPIDVIRFNECNCTSEKPIHPTQKPVALLEYLIRTYTLPGGVVLDNCMGSGSTGVACVNTGRNFIGIELDPGYFEIAKRRIDEANAQVTMEDILKENR